MFCSSFQMTHTRKLFSLSESAMALTNILAHTFHQSLAPLPSSLIVTTIICEKKTKQKKNQRKPSADRCQKRTIAEGKISICHMCVYVCECVRLCCGRCPFLLRCQNTGQSRSVHLLLTRYVMEIIILFVCRSRKRNAEKNHFRRNYELIVSSLTVLMKWIKFVVVVSDTNHFSRCKIRKQKQKAVCFRSRTFIKRSNIAWHIESSEWNTNVKPTNERASRLNTQLKKKT